MKVAREVAIWHVRRVFQFDKFIAILRHKLNRKLQRGTWALEMYRVCQKSGECWTLCKVNAITATP